MSLRLLFWLIELRIMLLQSHYRICVYENAIFPFSQAYCARLSVEHIIQAKLRLKYYWSDGV